MFKNVLNTLSIYYFHRGLKNNDNFIIINKDHDIFFNMGYRIYGFAISILDLRKLHATETYKVSV